MEKAIKDRLKRFLPIILVLLLLVIFSVWYFLTVRVTQGQKDEYAAKVEAAHSYYEAKDYSEAMTKYYEAIDTIPGNLDAYEGIVTILLLKNRSVDALNIVDNSSNRLSVNSKSQLYVLLGNYYYNIKDFTKAKEMYQKGLGIGVGNMEADLMLGKTLLNMGNINEAKRQLELSGYDNLQQSEATLLLSYILSLSDIDKAKSNLNKFKPEEKYDAYYEEFNNVLNSLDDDSKFNSTKLSRIFLNNGYPLLAVEMLSPKETELSEYTEGMYFLGRAYLESGQYQKAIDVFSKAITLDGMEVEIFWAEARANLLSNNLDGAIKSYGNAISFAGKNTPEDLAKEYISILLANKQYLKASESVTNILTSIQYPSLYILGIEANYELNELAKVDYYLELLEKAELSDAQEKDYLYWRIKMELKNEDLSNVEGLLDKLFKEDKYNPRYYLLLGKYNLRNIDNTEAKEAFEKAIELDMNNLVSDEAIKQLSNIK